MDYVIYINDKVVYIKSSQAYQVNSESPVRKYKLFVVSLFYPKQIFAGTLQSI